MSEPTPPSTDRELASLVRHFGAVRVLVIGDVILDRYRMGDAHRLSPEAPIPVLRPSRQQATLGGAANVALNIATLGGEAWLAGVVGDDAAGAEIAALLAGSERIHAVLVTAPARPTTPAERRKSSSEATLKVYYTKSRSEANCR